ncbi:pentapeptide repeat-containing protein [Pectobacterium colocasium]|uniref:pentapeptide repeat-containing protein n=1 Tax=Pectobacterium colocasium TaxID=2878098 RepID=UPI003D765FB7
MVHREGLRDLLILFLMVVSLLVRSCRQMLSEYFSNCDFSGAVFNSTRVNSDFNFCIFVSCKMKDVLTRGKRFLGCDFSKADLSKSNFYSCCFEDCVFDGAKLNGCNISGSTFVNTRPSDAQIASCSVADKIKFQ